MRIVSVIVIALLSPAVCFGALLPEALGEFVRESLESFDPDEPELFAEFGLEEAEKARYRTPGGKSLEITARRFEDATGAFAAFQWLHPSKGVVSLYGEGGWRDGDHTLIRFGNYVIEMRGDEPVEEHVEIMLTFLPRIQMSAAPPVAEYLPAEGLIPHSRRHILGPVLLETLASMIPPSVAAFRYGTEAQYAHYRSDEGESVLLLFAYPSSQISRGQIDEFNRLPGAAVKRIGSLVAVVTDSPSADEAERLLAKVHYALEVTTTPREPKRSDNIGNVFLDTMILSAILAALMIVAGVLVAVFRLLAARHAPSSIFATPDSADIVTLHLDLDLPGDRPS